MAVFPDSGRNTRPFRSLDLVPNPLQGDMGQEQKSAQPGSFLCHVRSFLLGVADVLNEVEDSLLDRK